MDIILETEVLQPGMAQRSPEPINPEIKIIESGEVYGKFAIGPLERGYGITIGNPIRRMLLSSIEGTAITWVKVDGVLHEYSTIPNVKEDVIDFLLNVKGIRIRSVTGRSGKMRLEINGPGRICAGDIATSSDFEIVNPEHHIITLDSPGAALSVEFNVERGRGYQPVPQGDGITNTLTGALPVDAIFSPVRKVSYSIDRTRVGHVTDFELLNLEVWTNGTVTPVEALRKSSQVLLTHFFLLNGAGQEAQPGSEKSTGTVSPESYQFPIDKMEVSPRTINCLRRANITKVGQVLELSNEELLKIRNFGEKSLNELLHKLREEKFIADDERVFAPQEETDQEGEE